jgi:hypothetical protein
VSGATLLLGSEDAAGVASTFSTTLYTGNGGTQTITNGIDLAGDGGLVWTKDRDTAVYHALTDTERGGQYALYSPTSDAQVDRGSDFITSFNSNGYSIGADGLLNDTNNYVSWTFKKQSSFFDVVTYTGNGVAGREIAHNLGKTVGSIFVKRTDATRNWAVYHRSLGATKYLALNETNAENTATSRWNDTEPTSTVFTVGSAIDTNTAGATYVAYLFAHDTDASSLIKCDSYTGNGSSDGPEINLGFEPQWMLTKRTDGSGFWNLVDVFRGWTADGNWKFLRADGSDAEADGSSNTYALNSTGFKVTSTSSSYNASGGNYIYIAIRAENIPTITYDPTLEWPGGTAPTAPAKGETDVVTFNTRDGGSTYQGVLAIDGAK